MKQKRYWLRGGLFGLVIGILYSFVLAYSFSLNDFFNQITYILFKVDFLNYLFFGSCRGLSCLLTIFTGPLSFMVEGVVIGFLYGKIKNRNKIS
jgi:hypothetical protein